LEGEKEANDVVNFKKVWKGFTLKGILEIYWSFKNPSFDYALLMYRFELLAELLSLRSITSLQKNAIKYLFVSDSEIYQVQNNLKTLQDLRLDCEFRRIMLNLAIKNAYSDLKNFIEYEEILEEALKNTFIFLTPKSFYGRTLISKQIVLGNFNNMKYDNEMLNGGLLYVFIHEFAHYIQRYSTKTFKELLEFNTPPNYNLAQQEAGFEIEKKLFGNPSKLYLTGKKFLFNIPDSVNQENILEEFKKANTPDNEFLLVRNMDSGEIESLDLDGYCGIHQRRITSKNYIDRN
jgi:predicted metal-dependent hydrolase